MKEVGLFIISLSALCLVIFIFLIILFGNIFPSQKSIKVDANTKVLSVNGKKIRYQITGNTGPVLILLHGFGGDLNSWDEVVNELKYGRIISLDLIGFGGSRDDFDSYSLDTHSSYLISFMNALKIDSASLIGSSMGASVAIWTAANYEARVKLIVFAPSGLPGSMRHASMAKNFYGPGLLNRYADIVCRTWIFAKLFPNSLARQALEVTGSYDERFTKAVTAVKQPVVLAWSSGDKRVPFRYSADYRSLIPHARLVVVPDAAGHDAAFFNPILTAEVIKNFVLKD